MDNDINYFKAVIDTANLISTWMKSKNEDIKKILSSLEINLEAKYGPFTSKLSNQIGINETLGLKNPDSYWRGVQDTLSLLKNFLVWKQSVNSSRSVDNFLLEIINKSNLRLEPDESPLISALGILFESEFSDSSSKISDNFQINSIASKQDLEATNQLTMQSDNQRESYTKLEESFTARTDHKTSYYQEESPALENSSTDGYEKAFDPKEFIDDNEFLDQFIADSINPEDKKSEPEIFDEAGRDYLRSALAELTHSDNNPENEKDIEIKFRDFQTRKESSQNVILESDEGADEGKESSRLLSSSLRDALKMLREEE